VQYLYAIIFSLIEKPTLIPLLSINLDHTDTSSNHELPLNDLPLKDLLLRDLVFLILSSWHAAIKIDIDTFK
jgi:hypothetical protein